MKRSKHCVLRACAMLALVACGTAPPPKPTTAATPVTTDDGSAGKAKKAAAEPDYWKGKTDLIAAPKMAAPKALGLPPITRKQLKNGISVLMLRDARVPLVTVKLILEVGSVDDPADKVGLSDFTGRMLRQGVKGKSSMQISTAVDRVGAALGVSPGHEVTSITCDAQAQSLDLCLNLVRSLVMQPTFPKKEMSQIRDSLLGDVKQSRDDPDTLVALHFYNQLYGDDHPAGRPMTSASIRSISRKDLLAFHRHFYTPRGAQLVISGAFEPKALVKKLRAFSRWRGKKRPKRDIKPVAQPTAGLRVLLVDKPDLTQSFLMLGHAGVSYRHPARDALRLANYVLGGGGFSSRLMQEVRSKGGKTYGVSSAFYAHEADGVFRIRTSTKNDELLSTLTLIRKEMASFLKKPPTASELAAAKGRMAGGYAIRFKTGGQLASALALAKLRGFDDRYVTEFPLRIWRLGEQAVAKAARAHILPKQLLLVVVGKGSVVAPQLIKAKLDYTRVSYLDAISARQRQQARMAVKVTPAEQRAGSTLVKKALRAMGGKKAFGGVKRMRISGKMIRGPIQTRFEALFWPPDRMKLTFILDMRHRGIKEMKMEQILAGKRAAMIANGQKRALPPHQRASLRAALFRQPAFVLLNALQKGVKLRPSKKGLSDDRVGVEVYPAKSRPLRLVFDKKTMRLIELDHRSRSGVWRISKLSDYKRVGKLWLPHTAASGVGKRTQSLVSEKVEINPRLDKSLFAF
jgi:zinc protease